MENYTHESENYANTTPKLIKIKLKVMFQVTRRMQAETLLRYLHWCVLGPSWSALGLPFRSLV